MKRTGIYSKGGKLYRRGWYAKRLDAMSANRKLENLCRIYCLLSGRTWHYICVEDRERIVQTLKRSHLTLGEQARWNLSFDPGDILNNWSTAEIGERSKSA